MSADINNVLGSIYTSTTTDQDNLDIVISVQTDGTLYDTVDKINNRANFIINEKQSLWIKSNYYVPGETVIDEEIISYLNVATKIFKVLNKGKGLYGITGTSVIDIEDLLLVETTTPAVEDVISNPETDIFYITSLGPESIEEYINTSVTPYVFQTQDEGYTIIRVGTNPNFTDYLFTGVGGAYGASLMQSTQYDYQLLGNEGQDLQQTLLRGSKTNLTIISTAGEAFRSNGTILGSQLYATNGVQATRYTFGGASNSSKFSGTNITAGIESNAHLKYNVDVKSIFTGREIPDVNAVNVLIAASGGGSAGNLQSILNNGGIAYDSSGLKSEFRLDLENAIASFATFTDGYYYSRGSAIGSIVDAAYLDHVDSDGFNSQVLVNDEGVSFDLNGDKYLIPGHTGTGKYLVVSVNGELADINGNIMIPTGGSSDLDTVLGIGNITDKTAIFSSGSNQVTIYPFGISTTSSTGSVDIGADFQSNNISTGKYTNISGNVINIAGGTVFKTTITPESFTANRTHKLPNASGTFGVSVNGVPFDATGNVVVSGGSGTVSSVALSVPAGFSVSGSPITTSGTLALSFASGYSLPSDITQASWTAKQNALSGTGFVKILGSTISYDNSTYETVTANDAKLLTKWTDGGDVATANGRFLGTATGSNFTWNMGIGGNAVATVNGGGISLSNGRYLFGTTAGMNGGAILFVNASPIITSRNLNDDKAVIRFSNNHISSPGDIVEYYANSSGTAALVGGVKKSGKAYGPSADYAEALSATATLDFPSVMQNQNATLTVTVTGAAVGDPVSLGLPNSLLTGLTWNASFLAWVSAANTVSIRFQNGDPSVAHDLASATFNIRVFK